MNPSLVPVCVALVTVVLGPWLANAWQSRRDDRARAREDAERVRALERTASTNSDAAWEKIAAERARERDQWRVEVNDLRATLERERAAWRGEMDAMRAALDEERRRREESDRANADLRAAVARVEGITKERDRLVGLLEAAYLEKQELARQLRTVHNVPSEPPARGAP